MNRIRNPLVEHFWFLYFNFLTSPLGFRPCPRVALSPPGRLKAERGGETSAAVPGDETWLQLCASCECCARTKWFSFLPFFLVLFLKSYMLTLYLTTEVLRSWNSGPINVCVCLCALSQQLMECCVNALVTSFKETILAECPGMIKRNETESEYGRIVPTKGSTCSGLRQEIALTQTSPH